MSANARDAAVKKEQKREEGEVRERLQTEECRKQPNVSFTAWRCGTTAEEEQKGRVVVGRWSQSAHVCENGKHARSQSLDPTALLRGRGGGPAVCCVSRRGAGRS